eukprot:TRINITY_DN13931_c0_g6_i1.p1 TRINITY_DN13931_c0_g6~~TRINITY_DN13931_c0_g6_i1.p1  ORF type:complete len:493 (+),score=194.41 TRINITY_DN13931_c0_g6_i1:123-1601(+)
MPPPPGSDAEGATLVLAEPVCPARVTRTMPQFQGLPCSCTVELRGVESKRDYRVELDLGALQGALVVFAQATGAYNQADAHTGGPSETTFYASFSELGSVVKYPDQTTMVHDHTSPEQEVFAWGKAHGKIYLAAYTHQPLDRLVIRAVLGEPLARSRDSQQPWRIAAQHVAGPAEVAELKQWFWERHAALTFGHDTAKDEHGRTALHHSSTALGDPRVVSVLLRDYRKFVPVDEVDADGRTALHLLAMHSELAPHSVRLKRAVELAELLLGDGGADAGAQDAQGWTPLHHAAARYCGGEELLRLLAEHTAQPARLRNAAGRTPAEECAVEKWQRPPELVRELRSALASLQAAPERADRVAVVLPPEAAPQQQQQRKRYVPWTPMMRAAQPPKAELRVSERPLPPRLIVRSAGGLPTGLDEERMRQEFDKYDTNGNGYLSHNELKSLYRDYESYGVQESDCEVEELIKGAGMLDDGRISFDEFCLLLLRIESR